MIYFDAAATSLIRPKCVEEAMIYAMHHAASASRGEHGYAMEANKMLYQARQSISAFFGGKAELTCFTQNATEALNTLIFGLFTPEDHVITTAWEHNSVLRPLYRLQEMGMELSVLQADANGRLQYDLLPSMLKPNTKAVVCTLASNVTGAVLDIPTMASFCRQNGLLWIADAAQAAGNIPVSLQMGMDAVAFSGHKSLLGPQGSGGICLAEPLPVKPLMVGGSGTQSYLKTNPEEYPARLESGTRNIPAFHGLSAAVSYLSELGSDYLQQKCRLADDFYEAVKFIPQVKVYGRTASDLYTPVVSLNIGDLPSGELADWLYEEYGFCVRSGAHCAPLMHEALGTREQGTVRFSFSAFNTEEEIQKGILALTEIAKEV